jgi:DeoR/GlpR family transcriptional regulator of sugar metabolism
MTPQARRRQIRKLVASRGECTVEQLAEELHVSGMTVRRDLQALCEDGRLIRTHGGATLGERATFEFAFLDRVDKHREAKTAIARKAVQIIGDCQSVMLDGSTTTLAIARQLRGRSDLTVITTSLPAAAELQHEPGIDVLLTGGYIRSASPDLTGSLAEGNLELLRAEMAFLGADGIDNHGNVFTNPPDNSAVLLKMVASAQRVYVVADHTKLGNTALRCFGNLAKWAGLITDEAPNSDFIHQLRELDIEVIVASSGEPT